MGKSCLTSPVAVTGLGMVSAAGAGTDDTLQAIRLNRTALREDPRFTDSACMTNRVGAVPDEVWIQLRRHAGRDESPTFLLANHTLSDAVQQAGAPLAAIARHRVGFVLSTTKAEIDALEALATGQPCGERSRRHIVASQLASDLASAHGACGPIQAVSVACISGLLAIQQGARLIQAGAADAVLVAGVDILSHFVVSGFSTLKSLDPGGCRPFDKDRMGLSLGEAAGAMVLMRADLAAAPLALIEGWGVSNDANHLTGPSRDGSGLALAIHRALALAHRTPDSIEYVNAHGTGTPYNDRMEALAFKTVFGEQAPWTGASKGLFGHTLGAAGVVETVVCIVAARALVMPGTPGFNRPDEDAPVRIVAAPRTPITFSRILKTNAGFAGTNAALVLEVPAR